MAAHERLSTTQSLFSNQTLLAKLSTVLPKDINFKIYHLSTPPTRTSSLYSAPPNARPDRTYCESHFLAVSIRTSSTSNVDSQDVLVFAIEILIYSTSHDTTFFVSKADSTGFLHLLGLPKGSPSPLRAISVIFMQHLLEQRRRPNLRSVVSLFARAQDQYLFPGSVEYSGKHVLDDRGLIRWWCRALDPLIEEPKLHTDTVSTPWKSIKGYLIVPGLDTHETLSYTPKKYSAATSWTIGHPLQQISRYAADVPPRCLIPHYPDDPKSRFLDELDDEITKGRDTSGGHWKSVRSIDQFWDMMAFRQECSAGRLVGFIWIVFEPTMQQLSTKSNRSDSQSTNITLSGQQWDTESNSTQDPILISPATSFNASSQPYPTSSPLTADRTDSQNSTASRSRSISAKKKRKLSGPIAPRQPRIKTEQKLHLTERPETSAYYNWAPLGRGQVIVEEADYKRITELLLRLDFATLTLATSSSSRWTSEVRSGISGAATENWGQMLTGTEEVKLTSQPNPDGVNSLGVGLVRKKRKAGAEDPASTAPPQGTTNEAAPKVNVLGGSMVRKKAKA